MKNYTNVSISACKKLIIIYYEGYSKLCMDGKRSTVAVMIEPNFNRKPTYTVTAPFNTFKEAEKDVDKLLKVVTPSSFWR